MKTVGELIKWLNQWPKDAEITILLNDGNGNLLHWSVAPFGNSQRSLVKPTTSISVSKVSLIPEREV
jgi:hypothetical protein